MKRTENQYNQNSKDGKITEKVLYTRIGISVAIIVICVMAMAFSAFAYFVADVTSMGNFLKSADYDVNVRVLYEVPASPVATVSEDESEEQVVPTVSYISLSVDRRGDIYSSNLKQGHNKITLTNSGSAQMGFCVINFKDCDTTYYTQQIGVDQNSTTRFNSSVTFDLYLPADNEIYIFPHWGTSSYYGYEINESMNYIKSNESINIELNITPETEQGSNTKNTEVSSIIVEQGDNLITIANQYNTTVEYLMKYNGITDANMIKVGQVIDIPPLDWVPSDETPAEETPAEETPTEETPAEETPAEETPAEETPTEETPAEETPAEETPAEETPAEETPTEETPTEETPTEETPAEETPTEETPTEETPTEETPTEETPAEETPTEETPTEETTEITE